MITLGMYAVKHVIQQHVQAKPRLHQAQATANILIHVI